MQLSKMKEMAAEVEGMADCDAKRFKTMLLIRRNMMNDAIYALGIKETDWHEVKVAETVITAAVRATTQAAFDAAQAALDADPDNPELMKDRSIAGELLAEATKTDDLAQAAALEADPES